jgi:hypothetical protein
VDSAISFAAVLYGEDFNGVAKVMEADAIIPDTETEFRWFDVVEPLDIAFATSEDSGQSVEYPKGRGFVNGAEAGLRPLAPNNFLRHVLLV